MVGTEVAVGALDESGPRSQSGTCQDGQVRRRVLLQAVLTVAVVGGLTAAVIPVVAHSDLATTDIRTAASAPPTLQAAPLPASLRIKWTVPEEVASGGGAAAGPTVVSTLGNRLAGIDPATGRERWSYRRGNARLCSWVAQDGVVVAAFAKSNGCRDLIALDQGTGARKWYRTLEVTSNVTLISASGVIVAVSPTQLIAVDPGTDLNRWPYSKGGCTFQSPAIGQLATVILATCDGQARLLGHDPYAEKERWNLQAPAGARYVLAADGAVAVLVGSGSTTAVEFYDGDGKHLGRLADPRLAPVAGVAPVTRVSGAVLLVWTGSTVVALDTGTRRVRWAAPADTAAVVDGDQVVLTTGTSVVSRAVSSGRVIGTAAVAGTTVPAGAVVARSGAMVVVTSGGRTTGLG